MTRVSSSHALQLTIKLTRTGCYGLCTHLHLIWPRAEAWLRLDRFEIKRAVGVVAYENWLTVHCWWKAPQPTNVGLLLETRLDYSMIPLPCMILHGRLMLWCLCVGCHCGSTKEERKRPFAYVAASGHRHPPPPPQHNLSNRKQQVTTTPEDQSRKVKKRERTKGRRAVGWNETRRESEEGFLVWDRSQYVSELAKGDEMLRHHVGEHYIAKRGSVK